jgi:uncharacterized protein YigA (DUF484 family)
LLTTDQVADFLRRNPGFFEQHVDVLMNLQIPHPHGGRAVSIGERQLVAEREKSRLLETSSASSSASARRTTRSAARCTRSPAG